MKSIFVLTILALAQSAFASEVTKVTCTSGTKAGDTVTVQFCSQYRDGEDSVLTGCSSGEVPYVSITKVFVTESFKGSPTIVNASIPAAAATVFSWVEDGLELQIGTALNLSVVAGEDSNILDVNFKSIKNSFKVVGCEFESLEIEESI